MPWGAAIAVGGSIIGGMISSNGAEDAAQTQADAANNAAALSMQKYQQTRNDLMPYQQAGQAFTNQLAQRMPELTANFNPTMDQLASTPGYQFTLQQGLEAAQNGFSSKGLGTSGAAMKGAADYATGLASNTLALQQQIFAANQQNAYNKLIGGASLGENAAAQSGSIGAGYVNAATQAQMGAANASAAGTIGSANAWANALTNSANSAGQYMMYARTA